MSRISRRRDRAESADEPAVRTETNGAAGHDAIGDDTTTRGVRGGRAVRIVRTATVAAVGVLAAWHIAATFLYATPATPLREAIPEPALSAYNYPMFDQNWSVFAPDPISADYGIAVRAAVMRDGELVNTEWVDAAKTELKQLRHNPLSPRAGYAAYGQSLVTKLAYDELSDAEKEVIAESYYDGEGDEWAYALERDVLDVGDSDPDLVNAYLTEEWRTTAYATQVAKAMWGDEVQYMQYYISVDYSVPFDSRHDEDAQGSVVAMDSGWRGLVVRPDQNEEHFADVFTGLGPVLVGEGEE